MPKTMKVRMNVSIASATWAFQPGMVVAIDADLAKTWVRSGHAAPVAKDTPVTPPDLLADLSAEEALRHRCVHCDRRASYVLRNRPYCPQHYRAEMET